MKVGRGRGCIDVLRGARRRSFATRPARREALVACGLRLEAVQRRVGAPLHVLEGHVPAPGITHDPAVDDVGEGAQGGHGVEAPGNRKGLGYP